MIKRELCGIISFDKCRLSSTVLQFDASAVAFAITLNNRICDRRHRAKRHTRKSYKIGDQRPSVQQRNELRARQRYHNESELCSMIASYPLMLALHVWAFQIWILFTVSSQRLFIYDQADCRANLIVCRYRRRCDDSRPRARFAINRCVAHTRIYVSHSCWQLRVAIHSNTWITRWNFAVGLRHRRWFIHQLFLTTVQLTKFIQDQVGEWTVIDASSSS